MSMFFPVGGGNPLGISIPKMPGIPTTIKYDYFFDRAAIKNRMDAATHKALYRCGSIVMQLARRSIKRKGMAAPKLSVMRANEGMSLSALAKLPGMTSERAGIQRDSQGRFLKGSGTLRSRDGLITESDRRRVLQRIVEIRRRDPSPAGSPPFTHMGNLREKPGILYAFDKISESVVIGQSQQSMAWIANLHEFGGTARQRAWAWKPRYPDTYKQAIVGFWRQGIEPRNRSRWLPVGTTRTAVYQPRPFMAPAIAEAIASKDIVKQFANRFKVGGT